MRCALAIALLLAGCRGPAPAPPAVSDWERESPLLPLPRPPLGSQADFATLPFPVTPERVRLGRWLFFDPRLSADGTVACASCHRPELAFSERLPHSTGIRKQQGERKAPSLVNIAWPLFPSFFWDGRAASLVEQARGPIANPLEMGHTLDGAAAAIAGVAGYREGFRRAFGDPRVDIERIAQALAAYEATRLSGGSPYNRFDGGDPRALDAAAAAGRELFYGKAMCSQCHLGWNFADAQFHNLGIGWDAGRGARDPQAGFRDPGRARISRRVEDTGAWKTPTLREVARHPPYMHDGSLPTLRAVIDHYDKGGTPNPWLSPKIVPLHLSPSEIDQLVAFLESLDGAGFEDRAPEHLPR